MNFLIQPVCLDQVSVGTGVAFGSGKISRVIDKKTEVANVKMHPVPDSDIASTKKVKVEDRRNSESPWLNGDTYVFKLENLLLNHEMAYLYQQK